MWQPSTIYGDVTLRTYSGVWVDGVWTMSGPTDSTITGYLEPISEQAARNQFVTLEEGRRWQGGLLLITDEEINLLAAGDNANAPRPSVRVVWRDQEWEVFADDDIEFTQLEERHHEYLALRVTQ